MSETLRNVYGNAAVDAHYAAIHAIHLEHDTFGEKQVTYRKNKYGYDPLDPTCTSPFESIRNQANLDCAFHSVLATEKFKAIEDALKLEKQAKDDDEETFLVMVTLNGVMKKVSTKEFASIKRNGKRAIALDEGDKLKQVLVARNGDSVLVGATDGMLIRFDVDSVRTLRRMSRGVRAINLKKASKAKDVEEQEEEEEDGDDDFIIQAEDDEDEDEDEDDTKGKRLFLTPLKKKFHTNSLGISFFLEFF